MLLPVNATKETRNEIESYPLEKRTVVEPRTPIEARSIDFEAFSVDHSTRAPDVGSRIGAGRVTVFYVPDDIYSPDRAEALVGIRLYIGEGSTITPCMVRRIRGASHTATLVPEGSSARSDFLHCGSATVNEHSDDMRRTVDGLAKERGVEATSAVDGIEGVLL